MKSVIKSLHPEACERIASGEQTIIIAKSAPKEVPFKAYIYCTKGTFDITNIQDLLADSVRKVADGRGKVIGEFICDKVYIRPSNTIYYGKGREDYLDLIKTACMTEMQVLDYMGGKFNRDTYFWHISNLKIYDKPKELNVFWTLKCTNKKASCSDCIVKPFCIKHLTHAPQSWQYVEEL